MEFILDAFDSSASTLKAYYEQLQQLGEEGEDCDVKIDALRALHDCFVSHTEKMSCELDVLQTDEEREADGIEEEVAELEAELLMLTQIAEGCDAGGHRLPFPACDSFQVYGAFATKLCDFVAKLTVLRDAMQGFLSHPHPLETESLFHITCCGVTSEKAWAEKENELHAAWDVLEAKAGAVAVTSPGSLIEAARGLLDEVVALGGRVVDRVADLRQLWGGREKVVKQLDGQQRRLVVWCRQQQVNLDALSDPDHIQEFCASLLEHYKVMSSNYRVLLESAEPFLDCEAVQEKLLEASESWVHLQVKALERLRHTLFEVHADTILEERVEEHVSFGLQVGPFLEELKNSLVATRNTNSVLHDRCEQLMEECQLLQEIMPKHDELCKCLLQFANRMRIMREAYACYRAAALSRVTYLASSSDILTEAARRKEDFESCVEEIQAWVDHKAKDDSWRDVREKVRGIKALLEREQQFLDQDRKETESEEGAKKREQTNVL
ncbi:hypothetical protein TCSYLVIO_004967 [Trypanosoma cruzi]|nr:hypothetical protein TCSYLVIO_004967 [Trypanosoma cruzi]